MTLARKQLKKYYISHIKNYSDKIPYFRQIATFLWRVGWEIILIFRSNWLSVDLKKIYWINPKKILYALTSDAVIKNGKKHSERRFIMIGSEKRYIIKFEERIVYRSFYEHFVKGKHWEETELYKKVTNNLQKENSVWGCSSIDDYIRRFKKLDKLYIDIKQNGIKTQKELNKNSLLKENMIKEIVNEIVASIGPEGELIHRNGQHRLTIAKLLKLDKIPIQILYRHKDWLRFRKQIVSYLKKKFNGKTYQPLLHPDLCDIPSIWSDKRFKLIKQKTAVKKGTLLDVGAHWGYFCHKFEDLGFQCTAMEDSERNLYFMKKLKKAERLKFNILSQSIFNEAKDEILKEELNFDIVLALNLFRQFKGMEEDLIFKLKKIFSAIKAKEVYFQIPEQDGALQLCKNADGKSKNLSPREFIGSIIENSPFIDIERIGEERNHGIYKIS